VILFLFKFLEHLFLKILFNLEHPRANFSSVIDLFFGIISLSFFVSKILLNFFVARHILICFCNSLFSVLLYKLFFILEVE
jgi:hypothetical protein